MEGKRENIKKALGITEYPWSSDDDDHDPPPLPSTSDADLSAMPMSLTCTSAPTVTNTSTSIRDNEESLPDNSAYDVTRSKRRRCLQKQRQRFRSESPGHYIESCHKTGSIAGQPPPSSSMRRSQAPSRMERNLFWSLLCNPEHVEVVSRPPRCTNEGAQRSQPVRPSQVSRPPPEALLKPQRTSPLREIRGFLAYKRANRYVPHRRNRPMPNSITVNRNPGPGQILLPTKNPLFTAGQSMDPRIKRAQGEHSCGPSSSSVYARPSTSFNRSDDDAQPSTSSGVTQRIFDIESSSRHETNIGHDHGSRNANIEHDHVPRNANIDHDHGSRNANVDQCHVPKHGNMEHGHGIRLGNVDHCHGPKHGNMEHGHGSRHGSVDHEHESRHGSMDHEHGSRHGSMDHEQESRHGSIDNDHGSRHSNVDHKSRHESNSDHGSRHEGNIEECMVMDQESDDDTDSPLQRSKEDTDQTPENVTVDETAQREGVSLEEEVLVVAAEEQPSAINVTDGSVNPDAEQGNLPANSTPNAQPDDVMASLKRKLPNMIEESFKELNTNLLRLLECPVCMDWMEPPMSQCRRGHLVCVKCRARLSSCPVCRTTFSSVRNRAMEGVAEMLRYPCRHGCGREVRLRRRTSHEANCVLRRYACPSPCCVSRAPLPSHHLCHHLQTKHPNMVKIGRKQKFAVKLNAEQHDNFILMCFNELFHLKIDVDIRTWGLTIYAAYIGPKKTSKSYLYEVAIEGKHNGRKIIYSRTTHSDLESASLNVSRHDCFHLSISQALNFLRVKNRHFEADNTLNIGVAISKNENEDLREDSCDS